jgi:hypothetical protein
MRKHLYILILSIAFLTSCIEEPEMQPNTYIGNFEALWQIIDTKYCYLDYKNINWDSIHTVYKARVDTVSSNILFFDLMGAMLDELKDGHVNLYSDFDKSRYWKWFTDYPANFNSSLISSDRYLGDDYRMAGGFKYKKIHDGTIGYMYYADFSDEFSDTNIAYILTSFSDCKGLIIDVRNNGGGYLDLSEKLASYFFTEEKVTGYICYKTGTGHSDFSKLMAITTPAHKTIHWGRPVIILTNRMSFSATNSFVSRMELAPKAKIVGDKTGGGGGLPLSSELPNGWLVRFSAEPMYDFNMQHIEWGISPDVKVEMDSTDEANGYDTIIETAISLIK